MNRRLKIPDLRPGMGWRSTDGCNETKPSDLRSLCFLMFNLRQLRNEPNFRPDARNSEPNRLLPNEPILGNPKAERRNPNETRSARNGSAFDIYDSFTKRTQFQA